MRGVRTIDLTKLVIRTGEKVYRFELPGEDAIVELMACCDFTVEVWAVTAAGASVCVAVGCQVQEWLNVKGAVALEVRVESKDAHVGLYCQAGDRRISERLDLTPVEVTVPETPMVPLRAIVSRLLGQHLEGLTGDKDPEIDLDEEFEGMELPEDIDEEFGVGAMEMDDLAEAFNAHAAEYRKRREKARKPKEADLEPEVGREPEKVEEPPEVKKGAVAAK